MDANVQLLVDYSPHVQHAMSLTSTEGSCLIDLFMLAKRASSVLCCQFTFSLCSLSVSPLRVDI